MAEVLLKNRADFTAMYNGEEVEFSSNTVTTRILQGLEAVKTASKDIWVNGPLVYTVLITNTSGELIEGAVFEDILETIVELDTSADVLVNGSMAVYTYSANLLTINLPDIEEGGTTTITFQVLQA